LTHWQVCIQIFSSPVTFYYLNEIECPINKASYTFEIPAWPSR